MNRNSKKNAVIITGRLDFTETSKAALTELHSIADVFVATDSDSVDKAVLLKPVKISFPEQDTNDAIVLKLLEILPEGEKVIQWYRLKSAWRAVEYFENIKKKKYEAVFKLRTDLNYEHVDFFSEPFKANEIYCFSDICFGGCRESFKGAVSFFDNFHKFYDEDSTYFKINPEQILKCDLSAAKFQWLRYPKLAGYSFNQENLHQYLEALHNRNLPENLPFGKTVTAKAFFQSSQAKNGFSSIY